MACDNGRRASSFHDGASSLQGFSCFVFWFYGGGVTSFRSTSCWVAPWWLVVARRWQRGGSSGYDGEKLSWERQVGSFIELGIPISCGVWSLSRSGVELERESMGWSNLIRFWIGNKLSPLILFDSFILRFHAWGWSLWLGRDGATRKWSRPG
jgi:hypothetical protein